MDEEQFKLVAPLFLQFKSAFGSSRFDLFCGHIEKPKAIFDFILQTLLPLFDNCAQYKFEFFKVFGNSEKASSFLTSLLQIPSIGNASSINIIFNYRDVVDASQQQLSVEAISNWLHKPVNAIFKMQVKRSLYVNFRKIRIKNMLEIVEHLKRVCLVAASVFVMIF